MPAVALPEEFSGDLMAVESRDLSSHSEQSIASPAPTEQPKLETGEEELLIPAVASPDPIQQPRAPVQPQTQPPAGGSIAQQYTDSLPSAMSQTAQFTTLRPTISQSSRSSADENKYANKRLDHGRRWPLAHRCNSRRGIFLLHALGILRYYRGNGYFRGFK